MTDPAGAPRFLPRAATAALGFSILFLLCAAVALAQGRSEFGLPAAEAPGTGLEVREPFFAFLIAMVEADSCGVWDGRTIAARDGRTSRFPLDRITRLERRRPVAGAEEDWPAIGVRAEWDFELAEDLDAPMPYDILGYHPGSLRVSRRLRLVELDPGPKILHYRENGADCKAALTGIRIFALVEGRVVLDADAFVDALLGSALDDAWTVGFVLARTGDSRLGLGVSLGRKGRKIFGEFDFTSDKVLPHGRPLASSLSSFARQWLHPEDGRIPAVWTGE